MPAPKDQDELLAGSLLTGVHDWLAAMPKPSSQGNKDWKEQPVDMETWLYDAAYMNLASIRLSDIQIGALKAIDEIDPNKCKITEVVIEWGKGSGKDLIAALMALRKVYLLLCLRDPYAFYAMAPGSGIELCNVAYVKAQAKEVFFKQLKGLLKGSRWFKKHKFEEFAESIKFPYNITMLSKAADGDSVEGMNMFFGVMDEAAAFKDSNAVRAMNKGDGDKVQSSAEGIYKTMRSSTRSRFPTVGTVVIISYPRYVDDFVQTKRKENELADSGWTSGPYATWEVNPRVSREDFKADYDTNPEMAAAMYECKPPFAQDGYIKHPERFITAVARGRNIGLLNPIDEAGVYSHDFQGQPGRYYAVHVDLALNKDTCALALGCQGEPTRRLKCPCNAWNLKDVLRCQKCERPIEQWIETLLPTILFPLIRVFARGGERKEVDFAEVREEILWIRERGHYLFSVTYDGWQSQDSVQILDKILGNRKVQTRRYGGPQDFREEAIVGVQSVDRTTEAHDTLKEFIYDERAFIMSASDDDPTDDQNQDVIARAYREWRALRMLSSRKIDHPRGGCFVEDTRVPLLDGSIPTIGELAGRRNIWLYSSKADGTIVPGRAKGFISKFVTELVDVVLDSGAVVRCTPEHRWMLRDGSYKEAQYLVPDLDRLMPINRQWPRDGGYEAVSNRDGRRISTHRMVMQHLEGYDASSGMLIHHLDHCKTNNHPENLQIVDAAEHSRSHTNLRHASDNEYHKKVAAGLQRWNLSDRGRAAHSAAVRRTVAVMSTEQLVARARAAQKFRSDIDALALESVKDQAMTADRAAKLLGCGRNVVVRVLRDMGFASWADYAHTQTGANHRVRQVIPVKLHVPVPVYDLEVEEWSNFALSAGVFVHNSKDIVDAMAGVALQVARMPMVRTRSPIISGWRES